LLHPAIEENFNDSSNLDFSGNNEKTDEQTTYDKRFSTFNGAEMEGNQWINYIQRK
jgi:hypothetical protein